MEHKKAPFIIMVRTSDIKTLLIVVIATTSSQISFSQETAERLGQTFIEHLTDNNDRSKGIIIIKQDKRIDEMLDTKYQQSNEDVPTKIVNGYRVQVYSSNERSAKGEADAISVKIKERFPVLDVYVVYQSPFWKVRVGNCETTEEVQILRDELKKEFPEYQSETYIVKDKVNIPK